MQLVLSVHNTECLLTVSGSVDATDMPRLRSGVLDVLDNNRGDVLLDMRQAGPVHGLLTAALAAARSRAKNLRQRIVVIDRLDGAAAGNLRQHGMQRRIPIYPDPPAAAAGLRAARAARARLPGTGHVLPSDAALARAARTAQRVASARAGSEPSAVDAPSEASRGPVRHP